MIYKYAHPEYFDGWKVPDLETYNGNLILWGAGRIGGIAAHCLKKRGIPFTAFCDIAKDKWGTTFCGHKVISPDELKKTYSNAVILITAVFHNSISNSLITDGFTSFFDCSSLFLEIDFSDYEFWMSPDYAIRNVEQYLSAIIEQEKSEHSIDQIFLNITTKCSLRCKNCSLFIPYQSAPCHYCQEQIMEDCFTVLNALGHVRIVNFYGGEPMLHPGLPSMIRRLSDETRIERISIITNGTIIPNEDLLSAIKAEKRFLMRISDYGALSSKLGALKDILEKNKIKYEIANYTYWDEPSKIGYMKSTEEELISKFMHCTACNVVFLLNRKLCLCSTASALCNMDVFPPSENNYVDLNRNYPSDQILKQSIKDFISRAGTGKYFDACQYCSGNHCVQFEHKVPVAEQTKELLKLDKLY